MNERFLSRGKRKDNGAWETGFLVIKRWDCSDERYFITDKMTGWHTPVIPETVGQCTGRKYANDKLLFEGDIVKWYSDYDDTWGYSHTAEYYGVVVWNANDYCWNIKVNDELIPFNDYDWDISMVVGNIHDNPKLLQRSDEE